MKAVVLTLGFAFAGAAAQDLGTLTAPVKTKQYIQYAAEQQVVSAGKRAVLELRFRVLDGYHVNSHAPKSDLQLPTVMELAPDTGAKVGAAEYPAGKAYSFSFAPEEKLDVYQDEFVVRLPVTAAAGAHELKGALHYQACDKAACYPPKTLALDVLFTAK